MWSCGGRGAVAVGAGYVLVRGQGIEDGSPVADILLAGPAGLNKSVRITLR